MNVESGASTSQETSEHARDKKASEMREDQSLKANDNLEISKLNDQNSNDESNGVNNNSTSVENSSKSVANNSESVENNSESVANNSESVANNNSENIVLNSEPLSEQLLERIQRLETTITHQNHLILGLAIAVKMGHDATDDYIEEVVTQRLNALQNISYLTRSLVSPRSMTDMCGTRLPEFVWEITDIKTKLKSKEFEMVSDEFQLNGYPNKAKAKIHLKEDGFLYTSIFIVETPEDDPLSFLKLKVLPTVYYVLKSQLGGNDYDIIRPQVYTFGDTLDPSSFSYECRAFSTFNLSHMSSFHNRNNAVTIEIHVEPPHVACQAFSYNKVFNWAIDKFKKRRCSVEAIHTSPYFYSDESGYRMQVHMLLNWDEDFEGKGITAHVIFLTGEFDEQLTKSFPHETTITLINQRHPGRHVTKCVKKNIEQDRSYEIDLGTFEEISQLISKDTLHYQVNVMPVSV